MNGDYSKIKHMMDQIVQEVHIQVEKYRKSLNNNHNLRKNINLKYDKKCDKKLAKIHGHKPNKKYKKLLRSYDPILSDYELVKALSDPVDKIENNNKSSDNLGTEMSGKANNRGVNDKSGGFSASTFTPSNITKVRISNILPDDNSSNKQPSISFDSGEISRNESIQVLSSKVECTPSPKFSIYQYRYKNSTDLLKLKMTIFKHDPSSSKNFKMLAYLIKNKFSFKFESPINIKLIVDWHSPTIYAIQQLLKDILQTLNQTKNKIIHFMTFLNLLFRNSVDTYKLLIDEMYYSFFKFSDFIKKCLLSYDNSMFMQWLPKVWNNCFYYGLILVEYILFNNHKSITEYKHRTECKSIDTLLEWSYVLDIQKLLKILSHNDNCYSENIIKAEQQDIQEPPKKKIKLTSDQQMFQQAQQSTKLTVIIENTSKEAQVILSKIT